MMLDVHRLRLLRELSIRGTLAGVAEALSYSPSSVSQQLSLLENEAGVELLRKVGRNVQLTPEAEILVEYAGQILHTLEQAESDLVASRTAIIGTVRLAIFQSAALAMLPRALQMMRREHPGVRVETVQHEPETALKETWARDFDIVVAEQYPGHAALRYPGLDRQQLTADRIRLAAEPSQLGRTEEIRGLADVAELPWVMEPVGAASRHWAEQLCRSAGFEPDVRFESADLQVHVRLVESGNAVALLPDLIWVGREPRATLLDLPGTPQRTVFSSVRRSSAHRPAITVFREVLADVVADFTVHGA